MIVKSTETIKKLTVIAAVSFLSHVMKFAFKSISVSVGQGHRAARHR